jgi:hypothetical protein
VGKENLEASAQSQGAEEFQRILQSDDIAPVDTVSYGKRLAEIILNALRGKVPRSED